MRVLVGSAGCGCGEITDMSRDKLEALLDGLLDALLERPERAGLNAGDPSGLCIVLCGDLEGCVCEMCLLRVDWSESV